jgi:arginine deiminase
MKCHDTFRKVLAELSGARVWTVREILNQTSIEDLRDRVIACSTICFNIRPGPRDREFERKTTTAYIRESISGLDKSHLIDLLLLNPRILINTDESPTGFNCQEIPLAPLANLVFTRDQQITTSKGVVIGRFGAIQRTPENELMSGVWPALGIKPLGAIEGPGTLEGGDFIPVNKELALLGVGARSTFDAAQQLMENDWVGTNRMVVVEDREDLDQQRMHLDTVFGLLDERTCVCLEPVADDARPFRRIAREFIRQSNGKYAESSSVPFGEWLKKEGYNIIKATTKQQEGYFINFLNLGRDNHGKCRVLAINDEFEKVVKAHGFNGHVETIDFSEITAMYGGAHCATQVLRRPAP